MLESDKRQKFTTTLNIKTLQQLDEIKVYMNRENEYKRIRGLNEVIEEIVEEKWGLLNDKYNKKR